jgi:hypothetical protein
VLLISVDRLREVAKSLVTRDAQGAVIVVVSFYGYGASSRVNHDESDAVQRAEERALAQLRATLELFATRSELETVSE